MFIQIGNDAIQVHHITAVRFKHDRPAVQLWLNALIGPRFFYFTGAEYEAFMDWWESNPDVWDLLWLQRNPLQFHAHHAILHTQRGDLAHREED